MGEYSPSDFEFSTGAQTDNVDLSTADAGTADDASQDADPSGDAQMPGDDVTSFGLSGGDWPALGSYGSALAQYVQATGPGGSQIVMSARGQPGAVPMIRGPGAGRDKVFGLAGQNRLRTILTAIWNHVGKKVALHIIVAMAQKWGLPIAASAYAVSADDLTFLIAENAVQKRGRGRRGPHLHTIIKRIKRGKHYEHMLRRWSHKAGVTTHHRAPAAAYAFHRRRRATRKKR